MTTVCPYSILGSGCACAEPLSVYFGCGSSREHAVWGLQQYGIQAVIASAYGEIFYSNAMNNRLLAVLPGGSAGLSAEEFTLI